MIHLLDPSTLENSGNALNFFASVFYEPHVENNSFELTEDIG